MENPLVCISKLCQAPQRIIVNMEDVTLHKGIGHELHQMSDLIDRVNKKEELLINLIRETDYQNIFNHIDERCKKLQVDITTLIMSISINLKKQIVQENYEIEKMYEFTENIRNQNLAQLVTSQNLFVSLFQPDQAFLLNVQQRQKQIYSLIETNEKDLNLILQQIQSVFQNQQINRTIIGLEDYSRTCFDIDREKNCLLKTWIQNNDFQLELLYRGSRDDFQATSFHQRCDEQFPTITFIKSEDNVVFGGYTEKSWKSELIAEKDEKCFIFALTDKQKNPNFSNNLEYYICNNPDNLVGFRSKIDTLNIRIVDGCNANQESETNFPIQILTQMNWNYWWSQKGAKNYRYKFKVLEIEVYKVIY